MKENEWNMGFYAYPFFANSMIKEVIMWIITMVQPRMLHYDDANLYLNRFGVVGKYKQDF